MSKRISIDGGKLLHNIWSGSTYRWVLSNFVKVQKHNKTKLINDEGIVKITFKGNKYEGGKGGRSNSRWGSRWLNKHLSARWD